MFFLLIPSLVVAQTIPVAQYLDGQLFVRTLSGAQSLAYDAASGPANGVAEPWQQQFGVTRIHCPFIVPDAGLQRTWLVEFDSVQATQALLRKFQAMVDVEYAERVPYCTTSLTPNDLQSQQWHLQQVQAELAWDLQTGYTDVVVAIVDDAVLTTHNDIAPNLWVNPLEIPGNNFDDDGNGYIDDVNGFDVADNDGDPNPPSNVTASYFSHGTHCAGVAAAATNNGSGIASIGFNTRIMAVKTKFNASGGSGLHATIQGVQYAIVAGADVISMSFGSYAVSYTVEDLFRYAHDEGIVLVAAAGNQNTGLPNYPAAYNHVISVGATTQNDSKAYFSNSGLSIDVMAPGVDIYSCLATANNAYGLKSGTSMACPLVSGLAALMIARNDRYTPDEIETCLKNTCDNIDAQNSSLIGQLGAGRINAFNALMCVQPITADFESDIPFVCTGNQVAYTDLSNNTANAWQWTFPGGMPATSTAQNPVVIYPTPGVYDVSLIVSSPQGSDTLAQPAAITVGTPSVALSGLGSSILGATDLLRFDFIGTAPYSVNYTDGSTNYTITGIGTTPYFVQDTVTGAATYTATAMADNGCAGTASGNATFVVDSGIVNCTLTLSEVTQVGDQGQIERVHETSDHGYFAVGTTQNSGIGGSDLVAYRTDALGTVLWTRVFGGDDDDFLAASWPTPADGLLVSYSQRLGLATYSTVWIELDANGDSLWSKRYTTPERPRPQDFYLKPDGHVLAAGHTIFGTSNIWLTEFDENMDVVWATEYDRPQLQNAITMHPAANGATYIGGNDYTGVSSQTCRPLLIKADSLGNVLWSNRYLTDSALTILDIAPGPGTDLLLVASGTFSGSQADDIYLFRVDSAGALVWTYRYGTPDFEVPWEAQFVPGDSCWVLAGVSRGFTGDMKGLLMTIDYDGNVLETSINGANGSHRFFSVTVLEDGNYVAGGSSSTHALGFRDFWLVRSDTTLSVACEQISVTMPQMAETLSSISAPMTGVALPLVLNPEEVVFNVEVPIVISNCEVIVCDTLDALADLNCGTTADFTWQYDCVNDSVVFTDASTDPSLNLNYWQWQFGDGNSVFATDAPSHQYASAGSYTVLLIAGIDSLSACLDTSIQTVVIPSGVSLAPLANDSICVGDSTDLGPATPLCGVPPYIYQWSPALGLSSTDTVAPRASPPGSMYYYVTVTDAVGNSTTDSVFVDVNLSCCEPIANMSAPGLVCAGSGLTFSNNSTGNGSTAYAWDFGPGANPASFSGPTPPTVLFDSAGANQVRLIVTDSCGADTVWHPVVVLNPPLSLLPTDTTGCIGDSIFLNANPVSTLSFDWMPTTGLSDPFSGTPQLVLSTSAMYTVEITSPATGCSTTDSIMVQNNAANVELGNDTSLCAGDSLVYDFTGAYPGATWLWMGTTPGPQFAATDSGLVWVDVQYQGCSSTDSIAVSLVIPPLVDPGPDTNFCAGDSVLLQAASAGPGVQYVWSNGSTQQTVWAATPGSWQLIVNNNGCSDSATVMVAEIPLPIANPGPDTSFCTGDSVLLQAASAGPGAQYLWTGGSSQQQIWADSAGTWQLLVNNSGCIDSASVTVIEATIPIADAGADTNYCAGDSVLLQAAPAGPGVMYQWTDSSTQQTVWATTPGSWQLIVSNLGCNDTSTVLVSELPVPVANPGTDTSYCAGDSVLLQAAFAGAGAQYLWTGGSTQQHVWAATPGNWQLVVNNNGCSDSASVLVTEGSALSVNLGNDTAICTGDVLVLNAESGPGVAYLWSDTTAGPQITVDSAGSYWVQVSGPACTKSDTIVLTLLDAPSFSLGPDSALCPGDSLVLSAFHANPLVTYLWSTASVDTAITVSMPGPYWAQATLGLCQATDTIVIDTSLFQGISLGNDTVLCAGDALVLDASTAAALSYAWSTGAIDPLITISQQGQYSITVQHPCGIGSDTLDVAIDLCSCVPEVPNVFTPNGDGINDELAINCVETGSWDFSVFSRWGVELFRTPRPHGHRWTGHTYSGLVVEAGVYFTVLINLDTGEEYRGYVHLLR